MPVFRDGPRLSLNTLQRLRESDFELAQVGENVTLSPEPRRCTGRALASRNVDGSRPVAEIDDRASHPNLTRKLAQQKVTPWNG